ncbi:transposase [Pectobacterium odoriferum]|uniref:transposase n=1 Tax=Pectobacterium odoriferum TaxID=78398 RepID=UPI000CD02FA0
MLESGKPVARIAQEIDIKENTLYNWKKLYKDKAGGFLQDATAFQTGTGNSIP